MTGSQSARDTYGPYRPSWNKHILRYGLGIDLMSLRLHVRWQKGIAPNSWNLLRGREVGSLINITPLPVNKKRCAKSQHRQFLWPQSGWTHFGADGLDVHRSQWCIRRVRPVRGIERRFREKPVQHLRIRRHHTCMYTCLPKHFWTNAIMRVRRKKTMLTTDLTFGVRSVYAGFPR